MADTKTIITRIKNKVDSIDKWQGTTGLLNGEIAIVRVPTGDEYLNPITNKTEPVIELLMKVGAEDSNKQPIPFDQLPWMSAKASDVYNWAKKANPDWSDFDLDDLIDKLPEIPYDKIEPHSHTISASGDEAITATGGELSVDVKHKEELGTTYTTATSTGASTFGSSATINIPSLSVNKYGHITAIEDKSVTIEIPTPEEVTLPSVPDAYVSGQLVTEVDQTNGAISVSRKAVDVTYDSNTKEIKLTIDGVAVGTGINASDFVRDGMIKSVELKTSGEGYAEADGPYLVFTWNLDDATGTDADTAVDVLWVPVKDLVDVYTAQTNAAEVQVAIENNVISATLTEAVKTKLNKAHEHTNKALLDSYDQTNENIKAAINQKHTHNFSDETALNGITSAKVAAWNSAEQNAKTYTDALRDGQVKTNQEAIEAINNAETGILAKAKSYADSLNHEDTKYTAAADGGLKLENNAFSIDDSITFIFDCGGAPV